MGNHKINALVAQLVMSWKRADYIGIWNDGVNYHVTNDLVPRVPHQKFSPSTDIAAAWQVVEKMEALGYWAQLRTPFGPGKYDDGYWCGFTPHLASGWNGGPDHNTSAVTQPMAICLAALKAVGVELE